MTHKSLKRSRTLRRDTEELEHIESPSTRVRHDSNDGNVLHSGNDQTVNMLESIRGTFTDNHASHKQVPQWKDAGEIAHLFLCKLKEDASKKNASVSKHQETVKLEPSESTMLDNVTINSGNEFNNHIMKTMVRSQDAGLNEGPENAVKSDYEISKENYQIIVEEYLRCKAFVRGVATEISAGKGVSDWDRLLQAKLTISALDHDVWFKHCRILWGPKLKAKGAAFI
ncbi:hypothetical protein M413DRAFT_10090 [Hebeloma cylindrosporum]|uniref:Uncharacterized protein n=1 Tax=Hebeloma cylindrosporum TaxID=76867 RepID=A0A0C3CE90_HEBCY|nr:hypothetical protein M413DRAFT_10090 [Hebeloma cylindrosporum h7]